MCQWLFSLTQSGIGLEEADSLLWGECSTEGILGRWSKMQLLPSQRPAFKSLLTY